MQCIRTSEVSCSLPCMVFVLDASHLNSSFSAVGSSGRPTDIYRLRQDRFHAHLAQDWRLFILFPTGEPALPFVSRLPLFLQPVRQDDRRQSQVTNSGDTAILQKGVTTFNPLGQSAPALALYLSSLTTITMTESTGDHNASFPSTWATKTEACTPTRSSPFDERRQSVAIGSCAGRCLNHEPCAGRCLNHEPDVGSIPLHRHRSHLPLTLYLLSFATPFCNGSAGNLQIKSTWRERLTHPYTLYAIGTSAAIPAGCAIPMLDLLLGYFMTGMTRTSMTSQERLGRGAQLACIMAAGAAVILLTSWAFPICCKCVAPPFNLVTKSLAVTWAAHTLTESLRHTYVASIIVQDATFFERVSPGEVAPAPARTLRPFAPHLARSWVTYFGLLLRLLLYVSKQF